MSKVKSIFKRSLAILLAVLTIMSVGLTSVIALNLDMAQTAGYVDLAETGANTVASDGNYRLYFKFSGGSDWWNGSGCYHFAWVFGTNMTSQYRAIYKVGTTNNASTGSTSDVFYMDIPSGTLTGMILFRAKAANSFTNGGTTWKDGVWYNKTNDITIPNSIGTYNLVTAVTENSGSITQNSRYTEVSVSSSGATVTNAQSGSGTTTDPYIVTPGQTMNVSATSSIADHNFKVGYGYNSSTQYTTTATGTVTASTTTGTTKSFTVYYTPLLNGSTSYKGTQTSKTIYYKAVNPNFTYTVTAGTGGTITSTASGSVTPGSGVTVTAQANDGYAFTGWTGTNGSFANDKAISTTFTPTATGATAKANFARVYTVTFYSADETTAHATQSVTSGSKPTALNSNPTKPSTEQYDYGFEGWTTTKGGTTTVDPFNTTVTKDTEYYPVFTPTLKSFDVTIKQSGAIGTVKINDVVFNGSSNTKAIEYGSKNLYVKAPTNYYIKSINGNIVNYTDNGELKNELPTNLLNITGVCEINIVYAQMPKYGLNINQSGFTAGESTSGYVLTVNGTNVSTGNPNATVETEYYAGEYTIRVHAPENYYISALNGQAIDVEDYIDPYYELEYTVNLTAETDVYITYSKDPYVEITGESIDGTDFIESDYFNYGSSYTINVPAKEGYYISRVTGTINGASVNYTSQDYSNSTFTQTIDSLTDDTELTVYYTAIPTFEVDVTSNDADAGTVTGGGTVYSGSVTNLTATVNTGYRFTGWTASNENYRIQSGTLESPSLSIIANGDVEFTANFAPVTGTINVTAGEGGTVTNAGTHNVTYPDTVTATATGDASQAYEFTHWTVESDGEVNVDYKVTENDDEITVQILTQDTEVNVTANFANAQKIKVYTYSDSDFDRLTITESNGTTTNTPVNNVTQSPVTFGEETWYTPGEVTLTAGFSNKITAQLFGDNPLAGGTGNLVMFQDTLGWGSVYFYNKTSSMYLPDVHTDKTDKAVCTEGVTPQEMHRIGTSNYYYIYVNESVDYIAFSKHSQPNYFWMYATEACYRGNDTGHSQSTPMFVPTNSISYSSNSTNYYNSGSWKAAPAVDTDTDPIDITEELYDGNEWEGVEEIWIYIKSDGTYIATTTNRRQLIDYVNSALMKRTYNNGVNDMEYIASLWTAFTNAYTAAIDASGDYELTEAQLKTKYDALVAAYEALDVEPNITITGSHGAEPHTSTSTYYGKTSFPGITTSTGSGNIGDQNDKEYYHYTTSYIYATIVRGTTITINTNVESAYEEDYLVYGWVVNGTEWVSATQDITDTSLYVGTYKCDKSAIIVPIYFRKDTIANWETDDSIIKIYANTEGASDKWGNYISAYTWMNPKTYYQFGHWTGQLMIPDTANPGMYYTFIETNGPSGQKVSGIAFTNYGNNTPINTNDRYQTYDYYEFIELAEQGYNNIVFKLKTFEGNNNSPKNSKETLSNYMFDYFRDFSGNLIDINREKIVEERTIPDPALYIIRTGPVVYNNSTGQGWGSLEGSDFYVDAYLYKPDGTYIGRCKTYELTNLEKLAKPTSEGGRDIDLTTEEYAGKPVMVDYASLTSDSGGNKRFDGEWYGTIYGLTNVTIKTEVAFQNEKGEIQYFQGQNNVDGVGQAYFNGEHFQEVSHGSENHTINAIVAEGNDFVGWYKAIVADDGTYTIDATAKPLFIERSVSTIDASADAVYVAVFKEHPEGTFTVNNYYYTYDDFKGQPMGEHLPPVFGGDTSYSIRDVKIQKTKNYDNSALTDKDNPGFAGTYTQSMEVAAGDVLEITIKTTPTYTRDYVYAWYIQANESDGKINFEEIGTNVIQDNYEPGESKEFTFTYTVEEGVNNITIYSDVVHITPEVTFTYIYNNRYNETKTYVVKYTLTNGELTTYTPSKETIRDLAPYVDDIYKNVTWEIENISSDATNWTLRASEADVYTVNVNVNGIVMEPPVTGRFNDTVSLYAKDIDDNVTGNKGIWYLNNDDDPDFDAAVDEILGYGTYYGLVITGDADVYFTSVDELINQIILADAVYGYERATDGSGSVTTNKVYVDYLISMLLNVYTGGYIDVNGNGEKDSNEPTVIDEENTNTPVSLKAISDAGYVVDYGMIHELLNTFGDNSDDILANYYKSDYEMDNAKLTEMLKSGSGVAEGESYEGALATYFYHYSAIDYKDYATNKNRVIMTFGFDNNDFNRSMFYNVKAYLTISVPGTTTINDTNTMFVFSNQATLNIAEADKITNGEATNS